METNNQPFSNWSVINEPTSRATISNKDVEKAPTFIYFGRDTVDEIIDEIFTDSAKNENCDDAFSFDSDLSFHSIRGHDETDHRKTCKGGDLKGQTSAFNEGQVDFEGYEGQRRGVHSREHQLKVDSTVTIDTSADNHVPQPLFRIERHLVQQTDTGANNIDQCQTEEQGHMDTSEVDANNNTIATIESLNLNSVSNGNRLKNEKQGTTGNHNHDTIRTGPLGEQDTSSESGNDGYNSDKPNRGNKSKSPRTTEKISQKNRYQTSMTTKRIHPTKDVRTGINPHPLCKVADGGKFRKITTVIPIVIKAIPQRKKMFVYKLQQITEEVPERLAVDADRSEMTSGWYKMSKYFIF